MASQSFNTFNGIAPSWIDIETTLSVIGGGILETDDYSDISLASTVEIGEQRGASGGRLRKRTTGAVNEEASITYYASGWEQKKRALVQAAPIVAGQRQLRTVAWNMLIQFSVPGDSELYIVEIRGCRIAGRSWTFTEGTDPNKVEVPISVAQIVEFVDGEEVVL